MTAKRKYDYEVTLIYKYNKNLKTCTVINAYNPLEAFMQACEDLGKFYLNYNFESRIV